MKYVILCLFALLTLCQVRGQSSLMVKRDTVAVRNAELLIQNSTRSVPGVLFNNGNGYTEFRKIRLENLGDTALAVTGQDTVRFKVGLSTGEPFPLVLSVRSLNASQQQLKWWKTPDDLYNAPRVGILGGSQGTGDYTDIPGNAISGRLTSYIAAVTTGGTVTNYSYPGYNTRKMMPNGANQWVDNSRNITKALADGNKIIILVTPSNDADPNSPYGGATSLTETMANIAAIEDACDKAGATLLLFSGFPRHDFSSQPARIQQLDLSNLLQKKFGARCAYVYKLLEDPANPYQLNPLLERGDHAHLNAQGAAVAFAVLRDVLTGYFTSNTSISKYVLQRTLSLNAPFTESQVFTAPNVNYVNIGLDNNFYRIRYFNRDGTWSSWSNVVQGLGSGTGGPSVEAGPDQTILLPATLSLSATANDPSGNITGYVWTKQSGGAAAITSPNAAQTTVTGLETGAYVFRCTVTNNAGAQAYDEVNVTVISGSGNRMAKFNFSPSPKAVTGYVNLYGHPHQGVISQTDPVSGIGLNTVAATAWAPNGTMSAVDNLTVVNDGGGFVVDQATLSSAFFTANNTAVNNLQLTGLTPGKLAKILVTGNASSSPRYTKVAIGSDVKEYNATGNSSKAALFDDVPVPADGKINIAMFASTTSSTPFGIAAVVTVEEKTGQAPVNQPPVVNAGNSQTITLPATLTLSATASDPDGTIASYTWTKTSGANAQITTPNAATTTVTGLTGGTYMFRCTVTDDKGATAYSEVQVTVINPNISRTASFNFSLGSKPVPGFVNVNGHPHLTVLNGTSPSGIGINTIATTAYVHNLNETAKDNLNVTDDGGGFIVPAQALANVIFTASFTPTDNLQVTGLTPGKHCKIILTANAVSSPRLNRVRIDGNVVEFNAVQNSSKAAVFDNLVIPADGKINIAFYAKDASSYAGLASAVIIEEYVN
ncbi:hypothetical protein SAMN04488128_105137 [Chitinophaga eiseniae]|uniref:PKD/Chitinase domain-containing protein n=1 Tax=Chitinophaga eiseniae TaxID=634771 RepID=A0A1T4TIV7_9BACT|nr:PKD domain-containing protein [Chitinophaga eiseniae]SKA40191.1 hypothetical protein SAMN04488128_105137 [Chitinophaga eiseniae]